MWVTWVNCKVVEDMMVFNHVVKFHENCMKYEVGDSFEHMHTDRHGRLQYSFSLRVEG